MSIEQAITLLNNTAKELSENVQKAKKELVKARQEIPDVFQIYII